MIDNYKKKIENMSQKAAQQKKLTKYKQKHGTINEDEEDGKHRRSKSQILRTMQNESKSANDLEDVDEDRLKRVLADEEVDKFN